VRSGYWQLWLAARELQEFTPPTLAAAAGVSAMQARAWAIALAKCGYLRSEGGKFAFQRDTGALPLLVREGRVTHDPNLEPQISEPQARLWVAMRLLREFCPRDLLSHAGVEPNHVRIYCKALVGQGILAKTGDGFSLARDLGPLPPACTVRGECFEPNGWLEALRMRLKEKTGRSKRNAPTN